MRIAWIGPLDRGGGVPGMGRMLMRGMLALGVEIDYFATTPADEVYSIIGPADGFQYIEGSHWWEWGRWYSRKPFRAFLSSFYARAQSYSRMCDLIADRHKSRRYDCIMQFSQMELLRLKKHLDQLPPVVVYPCVHAAGELTWHRRESAYARASEGSIRHYIVRCFLMYRAFVQRRQSKLPPMMIGMSKRFNELMEQDYGLPPSRMRVLYHPIEPAELPARPPVAGRKVRLVFAGRISVRKGVEMIVELSKRLDDLADQVEIEVIGGLTMWSDYRKHMTELNPRVAKYLGHRSAKELMETFARSDILVIPSHYEPGGLVVGEAAMNGMCIVASDEVGSAEPLDGAFVEKFKAGDMVAFERATRAMIRRVQAGEVPLAAQAHDAAVEQFLPEKIAGQLQALLAEAASFRTKPALAASMS